MDEVLRDGGVIGDETMVREMGYWELEGWVEELGNGD